MNKIITILKKEKVDTVYVIGAGYVGLANGIALAKYLKIVFCDNDLEKVNKINKGLSPLDEIDLQKNLTRNKNNISAINELKKIEENSIILICLPTDSIHEKGSLDVTLIESYVEKILSMNCNAKIVIKSTVPIGFTDQLIQDHDSKNIFFSPEFLREGSSYQDIISPNRIILGTSNKNVDIVLGVLTLPLDKGLDIPCITMSNTEAEAVKLFSNSFLAMRIAFFNELDSFGLKRGLNVKKIIDGISCDDRIGNFYNNPSFGFGGYCLPKDVIQLEKSLQNTPNSLISNIHNANKQRLEFIGKKIISLGKKTIGFYRLNAKQGSDNLRQSVSRNLLDLLADHFENIFIFEPLINESFKLPAHSVLVDSIECLAKKSEIIIANRLDKDLEPFKEKVFSRDIFNTN